MLFNSYYFIFFFLPATLFGFYLLSRKGSARGAFAWLVIASLFFYGWWNPIYLLLMGGSIGFNYLVGRLLHERVIRSAPSKGILAFGVAANLAALGFFKYANFFVDNINAVFDTGMALAPIVLPLAISFFTFQQISYLVDAYSGSNTAHDFLDYCLYVTFFPQLIAGPIVRSSEMLPQYTETRPTVFRHEHLSVGLTLFFIGLFKKVGLADGIAFYATPMFQAADAGQAIPFFDAWLGSLAYTLQLYFDFSGYSDMAVGLARMFGFYLPINFNSPYKANSVIDFWRRWHMTLSRFMLDYLYIPLGGNRKGQVRHYLNLMVTMLLGGLWHGASWNFVIWGGMQGMYLAINHAWENFRKLLGLSGQPFAYKLMARTLTFLALIWAWVIFRAETLPGAMEIYRGMLGMNGFVLDYSWAHKLGSLFPVTESLGWTLGIEIINQDRALVRSLLLLSVIWFLPNSIQWVQKYNPVLNPPREWDATARWPWIWQPHIAWALVILSGAVYTIFEMTTVSEFLYFQF